MNVIEIIFALVSAMFLIFAVLAPGLIPTLINGILGSGRRSNVFNTLSTVFIFATLSYTLLAVIYHHAEIEFPLPILGSDFQILETGTASNELKTEVNMVSGSTRSLQEFSLIESLDDIGYATLISLGFLIIWMIIVRKRLIRILFYWLRLTDHFIEKDVWTKIWSDNKNNRKFVQIRDLTNRIITTGRVLLYSEYDNFRELYLKSVQIHDFDHNQIAEAETAYLGLYNESVIITFHTEERRIESA